jgi:hypothetical protein
VAPVEKYSVWFAEGLSSTFGAGIWWASRQVAAAAGSVGGQVGGQCASRPAGGQWPAGWWAVTWWVCRVEAPVGGSLVGGWQQHGGGGPPVFQCIMVWRSFPWARG